jgi:hypothetical protein
LKREGDKMSNNFKFNRKVQYDNDEELRKIDNYLKGKIKGTSHRDFKKTIYYLNSEETKVIVIDGLRKIIGLTSSVETKIFNKLKKIHGY